jgi:hypothetical protein
MEVVQGRETRSLARGDVAVGAVHMRDDSSVIFHDMAVAINYSTSELA